MKKLRLDLDKLAVQSFEARESLSRERGSVNARSGICEPSWDILCPWTGDPRLDCWEYTYWPDCSYAC